MPLDPAQQAAINRLLTYYDGDAPYDPTNNPGGFRRGGNVPNFEPALKDTATAVQGVGALVGDAQAAVGATQTLRNQAQAAVATGRVGYDTLAELMANLAPADGAQGEVRTGASAGTYQKVGASGSGTWVFKSGDTVPGLTQRVGGLDAFAVPTLLSGEIALPIADAAGNVAGYFDRAGLLHAQVTRAPGLPALSDSFGIVEHNDRGEVIGGTGWDGVRVDLARPAERPALSDRFSQMVVTGDGAIIQGQQWSGGYAPVPSGPGTLGRRWDEITDDGAPIR
ncbi:hypothetical protein, partial [Methylorubrum extorquens]|uniref:hypothetical protein n=1 Tax=Methylorubrum extorquens TaxID=408 RepID=UPI0011BE44AA